MAVQFTYNVLTLDGFRLIARATASNRLQITGTKSCPLSVSSVDDLASFPLSWYTGKSGAIQAVSSFDDVAKIVVRYTNEGEQQVCKTLCVTAKIEGDDESVVLAAMSDPDSDIILPGEDDMEQTIDIPFNIGVTANDVIETTPGSSASIADLERFVSMYSAADQEAGEEQTVLGLKHFADGLTGCLPYPKESSSDYSLDIGAIVLLSLSWSDALSNDVSINAGSEISVGTNGCTDIHIAGFSTDSSSVSTLDANGPSVAAYTFRSLSGCHAVSGAQSAIVLGMCTGVVS